MDCNEIVHGIVRLLAVIGSLSLCGMIVWGITQIYGLFIDVKDLKNRIDYLSRKVIDHEDQK